MGKPLPVGTDTDEPTALLYLNPVEYRVVKQALENLRRKRNDMGIVQHDTIDRIISTLDGKANHHGS